MEINTQELIDMEELRYSIHQDLIKTIKFLLSNVKHYCKFEDELEYQTFVKYVSHYLSHITDCLNQVDRFFKFGEYPKFISNHTPPVVDDSIIRLNVLGTANHKIDKILTKYILDSFEEMGIGVEDHMIL